MKYDPFTMLRVLLLVGGVQGLLNGIEIRPLERVTLGETLSQDTYVHYNGDQITVFSNYTTPQRMCMYESTASCTPPYPPNDVCDAVTPGCTCMKWMFAGVSNTSVVTPSQFTPDPDCIDFTISNTGSVDFYFEMTTKWPVLPPGMMYPMIERYMESPLYYTHPLTYFAQLFIAENCVQDLFDHVDNCILKHTLVIVAGRDDWQSTQDPGVREEQISRTIVVTVALIVVTTMFILIARVFWTLAPIAMSDNEVP